MRQFIFFILLTSIFFTIVWLTSGCATSSTQAIKDEPALQYIEIEQHHYLLDGSMFTFKKRLWLFGGF